MGNEKLDNELKEYSILYPDTVDVQIGTQKVEIGEIKISQMKPVLKAVAELASIVSQNPDDFQNAATVASSLLNLAYDQTVAITAAVLNVDPVYLEMNVSLLSFTRLINAIIEVNDVEEIIKNVLSAWSKVSPLIPKDLAQRAAQARN